MTAYKSGIARSLSCPREMTLSVHLHSFSFPADLPLIQIAQCNELIVAKIARLDYPHNWCAWTQFSLLSFTLGTHQVISVHTTYTCRPEWLALFGQLPKCDHSINASLET